MANPIKSPVNISTGVPPNPYMASRMSRLSIPTAGSGDETTSSDGTTSDEKPKVLLIVPCDKYLKAANACTFSAILENDSDFSSKSSGIPEYNILEWDDNRIKSGSFEIKDYIELGKQISNQYLDYDGFVLIDSINTMAYTAAYLSFMFENLAKPVVITGSLSNAINHLFSDAKSNLLHAMVVAGYTNICEVIVCFNKKIYRGNRIKKINVHHDPFITYNYPQLGEFAATELHLTNHCKRHTVKRRFKTFTKLFQNIVVIHLIPQLMDNTLKILLSTQLTKRRKSKRRRTHSNLGSPASASLQSLHSISYNDDADSTKGSDDGNDIVNTHNNGNGNNKKKRNGNKKTSFFDLPAKPVAVNTKAKTFRAPIASEKKSSPADVLNFSQSHTQNVSFMDEMEYSHGNDAQYDYNDNQYISKTPTAKQFIKPRSKSKPNPPPATITSSKYMSPRTESPPMNESTLQKLGDLKNYKPKLYQSKSMGAHTSSTPPSPQLNRVKSIRVRKKGNNASKKSGYSKSGLKGVVLSFFGVGNAPSRQSFKDVLKQAIEEYDCEIVVTCQSMVGGCDSSVYASGNFLSDLNLINAGDMTTECCVAKLAYLMGKGYRGQQLKEQYETNLRGELTEISEKKRRVVQHIPMDSMMDDQSSETDEEFIESDDDGNGYKD